MTPEEFLKRFYPAGFPISPEQWEKDVPEIMESYAECLEAAAWVIDGSLPPQINDSHVSKDVAIECKNGRKYVGYFNYKSKIWRNIDGGNPITFEIAKWRKI